MAFDALRLSLGCSQESLMSFLRDGCQPAIDQRPVIPTVLAAIHVTPGGCEEDRERLSVTLQTQRTSFVLHPVWQSVAEYFPGTPAVSGTIDSGTGIAGGFALTPTAWVVFRG